jgi:hypothetical protein
LVLRIDEDSFQEIQLGPLDKVTEQRHNLLYVSSYFLGQLREIAPVHRLQW